MTSLKVVFAGTPDFSAHHLKSIIDSKHQLLAVYTQPDRPAGRGKKLQASPVKMLAQNARIPVLQPQSLKDEVAQAELAALNADVLIVVAYGLILPQKVLDTPRFGCINVHASLLPRWRGAAPIQRAIQAGDTTSGTTIMQMDAGLDTGNMLASSTCAITPETTTASLHNELAALGAPLLLEVLADLPRFQSSGVPQTDEHATYAHKILKPEAELDWSQDVTGLDRCIRAFNPFPAAFTHLNGERVKIWEASPAGHSFPESPPGTILRADRDGILVSCKNGELSIKRLQLAGGKTLTAEQILNSRSELFAPTNRFDAPKKGAQ